MSDKYSDQAEKCCLCSKHSRLCFPDKFTQNCGQCELGKNNLKQFSVRIIDFFFFCCNKNKFKATKVNIVTRHVNRLNMEQIVLFPVWICALLLVVVTRLMVNVYVIVIITIIVIIVVKTSN
jgi:hypothetical protein